MKTLADLYTEAARVAKMIEGTSVKFGECVKEGGSSFKGIPGFNLSPDKYEFALAIIDGNLIVWDTPKPKTVMVELLVEDAEYFTTTSILSNMTLRMSEACKKALEKQ